MNSIALRVLAASLLVIGVVGGPNRMPTVITAPQEPQQIFRIQDRHHHAPIEKFSEGKTVDEDEFTSEYWHAEAKKVVEEQLKKTPNVKKAKNIIFFLGDGMNHPSVAAARVYAGGEELKLSFENFPYTANSKTYCVDLQVSDSACTTTAYLNGIKANGATIGLNAKAQLYNCEDSMDPTKRTESIGSWAQKAGKDTGFVTTTRVTHASPAGLYAHISYRHWETDATITRDGCDADFLDDVTEQLVHNEEAKKFKVIFGGGSRSFINNTESIHGLVGTRSDGKNLIEEWLAMNPTRVYIDDKQKLMDLNPAEVDEVLGLFDSSHVPYNLQVQESETLKLVKPSLKDMTEKAIDILSKNEDGYFLFVEGGRIDHGHHETRAKYAVDETLELSKAVQAALDKVDIEETLIIVTADHGHAMSMAGYAPRGNDIFGYAGTGTDDLPYFTLSYANGPGYYTHWKYNSDGGRVDSRTLIQTPVNFRFPGTLPRVEATHGGDDVGIWAIGPWAHLFQGVIEQNAIPHILAYASCIGSGLKSCDQ